MFSVKKMTILSKQWSEDFSWDPDNLIKLSYYPSKWSQSPFWVQSSLNRPRLSVCPATGVPVKISRKWVNFQYCDWELTKARMFASDCFALTNECLLLTVLPWHTTCAQLLHQLAATASVFLLDNFTLSENGMPRKGTVPWCFFY